MTGRLVFFVGFAAWISSIWGAAIVPASDARPYATFWTAAVAAVGIVFVGGYVALSRPARDARGRRRWVGEWFWLVSLPALIMAVYVNQTIFRLILPAPASPTADQILAQRFAAGIAASVFFVLLWLTVLWIRRQVEGRRARREATDDQADYRNGWPPKA